MKPPHRASRFTTIFDARWSQQHRASKLADDLEKVAAGEIEKQEPLAELKNDQIDTFFPSDCCPFFKTNPQGSPFS